MRTSSSLLKEEYPFDRLNRPFDPWKFISYTTDAKSAVGGSSIEKPSAILKVLDVLVNPDNEMI